MTVEQITVHNLSKKKPSRQMPRNRGKMMDFAPRLPKRKPAASTMRSQSRSITVQATATDLPMVEPEPLMPAVPVQPAVPEIPPRPTTPVRAEETAAPMVPIETPMPAEHVRLSAHEGLMATARPASASTPKQPIITERPSAPRITPPVPEDYYEPEPRPRIQPQPSMPAPPVTPVPPIRPRDDELTSEEQMETELAEILGSDTEMQEPISRDNFSPFLSSVTVEKRPLSGGPVEQMPYVPTEENVYEDDQPQPPKKAAKQHKATKKQKKIRQRKAKSVAQTKHHKTEIVPRVKDKKMTVSMIILIIGTALVGVAVGVLVYFALFSAK